MAGRVSGRWALLAPNSLSRSWQTAASARIASRRFSLAVQNAVEDNTPAAEDTTAKRSARREAQIRAVGGATCYFLRLAGEYHIGQELRITIIPNTSSADVMTIRRNVDTMTYLLVLAPNTMGTSTLSAASALNICRG